MTNENILITRPLSFSENFFRSRTASGFYRNFQVTATYNHNLNQEIRTLFAAIRKTIIDYHILICNVYLDSNNQYIYNPLKKATFGDILSFEDDRYLTQGNINESFMKKINEITFELYSDQPLFKLFLVGDFHLCAVFEHTIADGVVGNYFHEILLENLQSGDTYGDIPKTIDCDTVIFEFDHDLKYISNSLPPPIDLYLEDIDLDYTHGDANFHDKVTPPGLKKWQGRSLAKLDYSLSFKLINFTPEQTKSMLVRCKQHGVSVTSYIQAIEALTLQPVFGETYTSHKVAMTLRRHYKPINHPTFDPYNKILNKKNYKILGTSAHMGFSENHPPIIEFSWDLVRRINTNIINGTKNTRALNQMKGFKEFTKTSQTKNNEDFFTRQLNKPKADAIKISNLGLIKVASVNNWNITNMIFSQDLAPFAAEFMLNVISTPLGGMNFVLSYYDNSFEDCQYEDFDWIVEELKRNMLKYCL
ncbi:hypothetical protein JA1_003599 [Spathaspora sp. JA1]|nr:hypothetical protein JA1_003599 [Spathaspora sp. JA1]